MKYLTKHLLWLLLVTTTFSLILLFFLGRDVSLSYLLGFFQQERFETQILELINPTKFTMLLILVGIINIVLAIVIYNFHFVYSIIQTLLKKLKNSIIGFKSRNTPIELIVIAIVPLVVSILLSFYMPISYDEAWTYLNFTQKGLIAAVCYYPAPNNHVLYSIITCFTKYIPFFNPTFCLRLPAILSNIITLIIAYDFIKRFFSKNFAMAMVSFMCVMHMNVYYSYMARGYSFLLLFFVISCYATFQLKKNTSKKYLWLVFAISNFLGFWTMPSFLYPFITLNVSILLNFKKINLNQIFSGILTVILVCTAYAPIIIINGLNTLANNAYVTPISRNLAIHQLPDFLLRTLYEITGLNSWVVLIFLLCYVVYLLIYKNTFSSFFVLFLLAPFLLLTVHSVIPFPRTFFYYSFVLSLLLVLPLEEVFEKMNYKLLIVFIIAIQVIFMYNFNCKIKYAESYSFTIKETFNQLKINRNESIYCNSGLADAYLLYNNLNINYKIPKPCNLDTILHLHKNKYYFIDKNLDKSKNSKPLISTIYFNIYE